MKAAILARLKRLEEVRGVPCRPPEFQVGYLKELPPQYAGERHIVTVGRDANGMYQWEERRGPTPGAEGQSNLPPFRVVLASPEEVPPALASSGGVTHETVMRCVSRLESGRP
jgi:hypothetical protein